MAIFEVTGEFTATSSVEAFVGFKRGISAVFSGTADLSLVAPLSFARNLPPVTFSGIASLSNNWLLTKRIFDGVVYVESNVGIEIVPHTQEDVTYVHENVGIEIVPASEEGIVYIYEGDVNAANPHPHLWHVTPNESPFDMQVTIYGSGFNHPTVKVFFGTQDGWTGVEAISVDHQWVASIPQTIPASALAYGTSRSIPIGAEPNVQYSKIVVNVPYPEGNTFDQIRIQVTYTDVLTSNPLDFQILLIPSFVKQFSPMSRELTLVAGSDTDQLGAINDGTAQDARFRRLHAITNLTDGTQRKMINESWNRWYTMDRSSIRMIHPCEEDFIVADPILPPPPVVLPLIQLIDEGSAGFTIGRQGQMRLTAEGQLAHYRHVPPSNDTLFVSRHAPTSDINDDRFAGSLQPISVWGFGGQVFEPTGGADPTFYGYARITPVGVPSGYKVVLAHNLVTETTVHAAYFPQDPLDWYFGVALRRPTGDTTGGGYALAGYNGYTKIHRWYDEEPGTYAGWVDHALPHPYAWRTGIVADPDGNVWLTGEDGSATTETYDAPGAVLVRYAAGSGTTTYIDLSDIFDFDWVSHSPTVWGDWVIFSAYKYHESSEGTPKPWVAVNRTTLEAHDITDRVTVNGMAWTSWRETEDADLHPLTCCLDIRDNRVLAVTEYFSGGDSAGFLTGTIS